MSEELDRRVAIEIMGEEEPPKQTVVFKHYGEAVVPQYRSENWISVRKYEHRYEPKWEPKAFSSSTEEALRAVDTYFAEWSANLRAEVPSIDPTPQLKMQYSPHHDKPYLATFSFWCGYGQTLAEAICRLLLALKESQ